MKIIDAAIVAKLKFLTLFAVSYQDRKGVTRQWHMVSRGAPPKCIEEVAAHVRTELTQPEVRRRYKLRRCCMKLLCGVSGTGKSLAIAAIHRRLYEIMSEVTGVPLDRLPGAVEAVAAVLPPATLTSVLTIGLGAPGDATEPLVLLAGWAALFAGLAARYFRWD